MGGAEPFDLVLASASPRRRELLASVGLRFRVVPSQINEQQSFGETEENYVLRLSREKAQKVSESYPGCFVLAADTIVVLPNAENNEGDRVLEKPASKQVAAEMLRALSGRTHFVITAFSILCRAKGIEHSELVKTEVIFRKMSDEQIAAYVATGEPLDKAGAYAIQGKAAAFVEAINGSYTNVVGLPLPEVLNSLGGFNVWTPNHLLNL